jgi:hypothetical protein
MGYFYFDETIRDGAGFILGAFIYSDEDLTEIVRSKISEAGLRPRIDEFKSGAMMSRNPRQIKLRDLLQEVVFMTRVGIVIVPQSKRGSLGDEAMRGLEMLILRNDLANQSHSVFFDEGIQINAELVTALNVANGAPIEVNMGQNSRIIGGIQVADLVAHSLGTMLLEKLGLTDKVVRIGEGNGYDPDETVELGFLLWASLRYQFFRSPAPYPGAIPDDPVGDMVFDVENYGLHISPDCSTVLRAAARELFGSCYLGCIH